MAQTADLELMADKLAGAFPQLDQTGRELALNLIRLLALGAPVGAADLARRVGVPEDRVAEELDGWPAVYRDDDGRVIGYAGLTVLEMGDHRIRLDGRTLSTWCAYDTLYLPELLGETVGVSSRCPVTGESISLTVGPDGVADLRPQSTVVSLLTPDQPLDSNMIRNFCHFVHFFSSREAAGALTSEHPGTFTLSVEDAFRLGQLVNHRYFGAVLTV